MYLQKARENGVKDEKRFDVGKVGMLIHTHTASTHLIGSARCRPWPQISIQMRQSKWLSDADLK
jgi:hypothetical protein